MSSRCIARGVHASRQQKQSWLTTKTGDSRHLFSGSTEQRGQPTYGGYAFPTDSLEGGHASGQGMERHLIWQGSEWVFFLKIVQNIEHIDYEKWRCKHLRYFTSKLYVNLQFTIRSDYKALWPESRNAMREKDARCKLKLKWCQDFECSNWILMIQGWTSWFCVDISVGGFQLPEMVERRDFQRSLIDSQVGCCGVADEKPVIGCLC